MSVKFIGFKVLGVNVDKASSATQEHPLGLRVQAEDSSYGVREYEYVKAGAAVAATDALRADHAEEDLSVMPSDAADLPLRGVAHVAISDNEFAFIVVKGAASVKAAATVVAGTPAIPTATGGTLDDTAATAANALAIAAGVGATFLSTTSGGVADVLLS
jgi:hypothetical protein